MDITTLSIDAPKGPFPILQFDAHNKRGVEIGHGETVESARFAIQAGAAQFLNSQKKAKGKPPRTVRYIDPHHVALFYSDGKLAAFLAIEVVPIPKGETHVADILVDKAGAK